MKTPANSAAALLSPYSLGPLTLRNRVVMAPLTRSRADAQTLAPRALNAEYYAQRAGAGLIISEGSQVSQQGQGYAWTPGIYSEAQIAGWRQVTDAVHALGGTIFIQLWHVGRISHPELQPDGALPVAPSAIRPEGQAFTNDGFKPMVEPRALETSEIPGIVEQFRQAARNARAAGFDGAEIHSANGYLLEQFLRSHTNRRSDAWGGSLENRTRLLLEVVAAVGSVFGLERTGVRLSPATTVNDIGPGEPELAAYVLKALDASGVGFVHMVEGVTGGARTVEGFDFRALRKLFPRTWIANNGYDGALGAEAVASGHAELVAFGKPWISNPDLVERLATGLPLAQPDKATLYGGDAHGYTDYPRATPAALA